MKFQNFIDTKIHHTKVHGKISSTGARDSNLRTMATTYCTLL